MKDEYFRNVYFFKNDDQAYLDFITENGGYVYNDFGGSEVKYKKLHRYDCAALHNLGRGSLRTSVRKVCSGNLKDLLEWLNKERGIFGKGYSECPYCIDNNDYKTVDFDNIPGLSKSSSKSINLSNPTRITSTYHGKQIDAEHAKRFAGKLIDIYNNKKIPVYIEHFKKAGFTRESLTSDINKTFQMIILAAYDQQPFTRAARGWEPIWFELPEVLTKLELYSLKGIKDSNIADIENKLKNTTFYNYHLDSKGTAGTSYAETFIDTLSLCEDYSILKSILTASSSNDVRAIQELIAKKVKNIGKMIASKIIMYTMREIKIGIAQPKHFDLIVEDLLGEYHNNKFAKEIELKHGNGFIEEVIKNLKKTGDPLAIDALYFVDRDLPQLKKELL